MTEKTVHKTPGVERQFVMPKEMALGAPTLRVRELDETLGFYESVFGLEKKSRYRTQEGLEVYQLGPPVSSETLLILKHDPSARVPRPDFAGLYHYAVLVPDRKSLASTYLAVGNKGAPFDGFADHYVSEALYLHDAERNGIEIYADRGRETWSAFKVPPVGPRDGVLERFSALNKPLDLNSLVGELSKADRLNPSPFSAGAWIGHIHLRVTDLERSVKFYHERLGLDVVTNLPEIGAAFLSVGGYHHHIGLNTWQSARGTPHQPGDGGLDDFTMVVPDEDTLGRLRTSLKGSTRMEAPGALLVSDPDGIEIRLRTGTQG